MQRNHLNMLSKTFDKLTALSEHRLSLLVLGTKLDHVKINPGRWSSLALTLDCPVRHSTDIVQFDNILGGVSEWVNIDLRRFLHCHDNIATEMKWN